MKRQQEIMGMNVVLEIADKNVGESIFDKIFSCLRDVDERFSPYKKNSELSRMNRGEISADNLSQEMKEVLKLSEQTKNDTNGYFDIRKPDGSIDTCGMVKGWAIQRASEILDKEGFKNYCLEIAGDIQVKGNNSEGKPWAIGIRSPVEPFTDIIKVLSVSDRGIATSGSSARGEHIYDSHTKKPAQSSIISITVIGPNIYEADRFATAAFAMGERGIDFIEGLSGFEGYSINRDGIATMTSNFNKYVK